MRPPLPPMPDKEPAMTPLNPDQHGFATALNLSFAPILLAYLIGALPVLVPVLAYRLVGRLFGQNPA